MQACDLLEGLVVRDQSRKGRVGTILNWESSGYGGVKVTLYSGKRQWSCSPHNLTKLLDATVPFAVRSTLPGVLSLIESFESSVIQLQCSPALEFLMEAEVRALRKIDPTPGQIYVDHDTAKVKPTTLRGRVCFDPRLIPFVQSIDARVSWSERDQVKGCKARAYEWWFVAEALRSTRIPIGCSNEWLDD